MRDGTVVVEAGRIVYVGPRPHAPPGADVELTDAILLPGLVNAHCHLELTAMRGFLEGLAFREWILRLTAARRAVLSPADMLDAARQGIREGLAAGITTFADTGDSGAGFDAMREAGVRGVCYRETFGPDPTQCRESLARLREAVQGMRGRETDRVRVGVSPHAPYTVSDALFRGTAELARELGAPLAVHIAESALESELVERAAGAFADGLRARGIPISIRGRSSIELLETLGVLDVAPLLIHCVRATAADRALVVRRECGIAHCPVSNARLGHGAAPLRAFLDRGARVGLGSDSMGSNDRMDLLEEARAAVLMANVRERRHDALSPREALTLATIGGARALRLEREIGTLEVGKRADLAAFRIPEARRPLGDVEAALIHAIAGTRALFVAVDGEPLVTDGTLVRAGGDLAARTQRSADRLAAWLASAEGQREAAAPPIARGK